MHTCARSFLYIISFATGGLVTADALSVQCPTVRAPNGTLVQQCAHKRPEVLQTPPADVVGASNARGTVGGQAGQYSDQYYVPVAGTCYAYDFPVSCPLSVGLMPGSPCYCPVYGGWLNGEAH